MEKRSLLDVLDEVVALEKERESWNKRTGKALREAREAAGLSQEQLATAAGVSQPYLSNVERGNGVSTETLASFRSVIAGQSTGGTTDDRPKARRKRTAKA